MVGGNKLTTLGETETPGTIAIMIVVMGDTIIIKTRTTEGRERGVRMLINSKFSRMKEIRS
jgi:hypothetical protein